jgi:hypothetical protein
MTGWQTVIAIVGPFAAFNVAAIALAALRTRWRDGYDEGFAAGEAWATVNREHPE